MSKGSVGEYQTLPLLPLRDVVIFPGMMMPFVVGRDRSVQALEQALQAGKKLFLSAQKDAEVEDPGVDQIYEVGTISTIVQSLKRPDGTIKVLVEGVRRAQVIEHTDEKDFLQVVVKPIGSDDTPESLGKKTKELIRRFEKYVKLSANLPNEAVLAAVKKDHPGRLADTIAAHLPVDVNTKQELLEVVDIEKRLDKLIQLIVHEVEKVRMDKQIQGQVKKQMEQAQREYYLNEKIKAIQQELGRGGGKESEVEQLRARIAKSRMPAIVREKAEQELERLEAMPPMSAEATVSRNYVDWLVSVPWFRRTRENTDLKRAAEVLEEDHFGLDKIKERILEFLAVRQLVDNMKGSILCFVGGPGTGKSSLGRSIARATSREFIRLSLGGVRDEAEIRGHRRTYIGAFPGQIVQCMRKAGVINPIFMLDEIDKMSMDFRGDPSSALMEVLDPEQNNSFVDHYLDAEYDLSRVMFICTANVLHTIPAPLQDRMEILRFSGYTQNEKVQIARRHVLPKQIVSHGLLPEQFELTDEALDRLIEEYTREAGVRTLERQLARVCRKGARDLVETYHQEIADVGQRVLQEEVEQAEELMETDREDPQAGAQPKAVATNGGGAPDEVGEADIDGEEDDTADSADPVFVEPRDPMALVLPQRSPVAEAIPEDARICVDVATLEEFLGVPRFKRKQKEEADAVGLAAGLAWTERGGEILAVEATLMPGKGKLSLTGKLGDIMQESGQAALSYIRSKAAQLGARKDFYQKIDIHVHVPEGAIPKDGPSAGITVATAVVSALTGIAVRNDVAMTGEITLRGKVLPIGGLKEKILAAHRATINTILVPAENEKDLKDVPDDVKGDLTIHMVDTMDEVLKLALVSPPTPVPETEDVESLTPTRRSEDSAQPPLTH